MCTKNWAHSTAKGGSGGTLPCDAIGCGGAQPDPGGGSCALVLIVGALVAGLLGLGGYVGTVQAYAAVTHSEVSR